MKKETINKTRKFKKIRMTLKVKIIKRRKMKFRKRIKNWKIKIKGKKNK